MAELQVPAADRLAPEHRVERGRFLDLDLRNAKVGGELLDVRVGHVAAIFLDAPYAGQHQR